MSDPFAAKNPTKKDPPSASSSGKPDEAASNADAKVAAATTTNETLNEDDTPVGEPPFKKFKIPRERRSGKIAELEIKEVFDSSKPRKYSKHDQKWEDMYKELVKYKEEHNSMLVPQCYKPNRKLGRWVHYQRVEYWTYQQTKNAKINPYRITKLNDVGFIWDPQNYTWNQHYEKLVEFVSKHGNCRVPKGYKEDPELANWVRNQRLEFQQKNKRMTEDRVKKLNAINFSWSVAKRKSASDKDKSNTKPSKSVKLEAPKEKKDNKDDPNIEEAKAVAAPTEV